MSLMDEDGRRRTTDERTPMPDEPPLPLPVRHVLDELIAIPTTRGAERDGMVRLREAMGAVVDRADLVPVDDSIRDDPRYAFPLPGHRYTDTVNLECVIEGTGQAPPIVLNTHMDVVPASEGQDDAFTPVERAGAVYGRGACDAKGQIATLYALAMLVREHGRPPGDVIFHVVVEEENGGNGTLAMVRRGVDAQAAVVLEPSELAVFAAVRGAVWFRLRTVGRAGHSGSQQPRISALDQAIDAMTLLRDYHDRRLERSRGLPLFEGYDDPMPLTFGECHAGAWPASVPSEAVVTGVLGFLPDVDQQTVQTEMRETLLSSPDAWLREHAELTFPMLNNDGYQLPESHPLVTSLVRAVRAGGTRTDVRAMTASCDAWLYNNVAGIPTVVFGPGSLAHAHGKDEHIRLADIMTAAHALHGLIMQGVSGTDDESEDTR